MELTVIDGKLLTELLNTATDEKTTGDDEANKDLTEDNGSVL